jgi:hypothetical protein
MRPGDPAQVALDPDRAIWEFPSAAELLGADTVWEDVLETLRPRRWPGQYNSYSSGWRTVRCSRCCFATRLLS